MSLFCNEISTPVGELKLVANDRALVAVLWSNLAAVAVRFAHAERCPSHPVLRKAEAELAEYFARDRTAFTVPLSMEGTDFQQQVWRQLQQIPYGGSVSYGHFAKALNRPTASRAVGAACGQNPIPILVPCHRVVGRQGKLTGFAGGLPTKAYLLALEDRSAGHALTVSPVLPPLPGERAAGAAVRGS